MPTNPALASACAAIKACADLTHDGDERQLYIEWDDAALTALVASLLPPSDATAMVPTAVYDSAEYVLRQLREDYAEDYSTRDIRTACEWIVHTRRRTPGEEQGNG